MATQISLAGSSFSIFRNQYSRAQKKYYSERRTITGALDRLDTGIFENRYRMTIVAACADVANLRTAYSNSASTSGSSNKLEFTDLEGTIWNSASTGSGILNTGVYFNGELNIRPYLVSGWLKSLVEIELIAIATKMAGS